MSGLPKKKRWVYSDRTMRGDRLIVRVVLHMEPLDSGATSWWAESPDLAGFSAAADSLVELRGLCTEAVHEIAAEDGLEVGRIAWSFAQEDQVSGNPARAETSGAVPAGHDGAATVAHTASRVLEPA